MIELRGGQPQDTKQLASLVFDSAPILLPYLFGGESQALDYIQQAMHQEDGQYSAKRHIVACGEQEASDKSILHDESLVKNDIIFGCLTLWHDGLSEAFHQQTLSSLSSFLSDKQLRHLVTTNPSLMRVFVAPSAEELCIGHLAVEPLYQGNGVGKALIACAIKQGNNLAKKRLVLDVDAANSRAIHFYQSCDFIQEAWSEFSPTQQRFVRMSYTL
jgi:GNAT superfamily N-acetyltransferase